MESGGQIVLPIFYEVEPAHVRYQKGDFGTAFSQFSKNYIVEDIEKWKQALQKVGSLKGWELKRIANSGDGKLLELVVTRVSRELSAMQMDDIEQPVGIDDVVEDILRLLDNKPCATQIIGIHGMGVSNQLISDILNTKDQVSNTCDANNFMASRFKYTKVLIILDGVEDQNKLSDLFRKEWFMTGSRVIITTRNRSVLEHFEVNYEYKVKEIDADQSLILFSRHAFRRDSPPCEFESLASAVVSTTGGLPLALKVIGSLLRGKEEGFWQDTLEKLRKVPIKEVQEKLRISFEALSDEGKEIFLDIACFLIGTDLRIASYIWHARDLQPRMEILILSSMSLITIGDNHVLKMHDQLRNLGKKIASQGEPKERSRLWVFDEFLGRTS
ncbi:disease resistance protein L6-like [Syzygium oleosum]|uniref:disease resistance protein L6-like n=1 Tax=Syzygium oleosum TaxID=219896 RepID=UPI0024BBA89C|nr:disease resistance protein L6-like [Syzygium oleosum]